MLHTEVQNMNFTGIVRTHCLVLTTLRGRLRVKATDRISFRLQ